VVKIASDVIVIGGGIAGIQASLDLADKGLKVHLVEKEPSIGGRMAQLDKTFPTNDCSICILSPKMADCYAHENIDVMTYSEILEVGGKAGDFNVKVLKKARYIDMDKCNGCGDCLSVCPVSVPNSFDMNLGQRKAIYIPFLQAVPKKMTIDKRGIPPCQATCPAGVHVQGYIALISNGKYKEALELHREHNPLPLICGRVCPHPCEDECNRGELDQPIAIAALKRFIADYELEHMKEIEPFERTSNKKIAVIGSGPAGLSAAYYLAKMGYEASIFEALPMAGGMLAVGIPDYRLPKDILEAEIDYIKKKGVEIKLNKKFLEDFNLKDLKKDGFDAIFLGTGAHASKKMAIHGEDLEGVIPGVEFLREINLGRKVNIGKRVAVIGGGDVAIDAVRVAHRLGSEAFILYRRTRNEMPAHESEIEETLEEGIEIDYLVQPVRILSKKGKVVGIECMKMELGEADESGRRRPMPVKGSKFMIEVDTVMPAIGQSPDLSFLEGLGLKVSKTGTIIVDENTYATNLPGVFAAGDAVSGPATVVMAVGAGRKAAITIDAYLQGEDVKPELKEENVVKFEDLRLKESIERKERLSIHGLPPSERKNNFEEVVRGLSEEESDEEAKRCLNCGICSGCHQCIKPCGLGAIDYNQRDELIELDVGSIIVSIGFETYIPDNIPEYGYGKFDNVITAMEFERLISAAGPTRGHLERKSDKKSPKRLAFIQCVGSRDMIDNRPYCCNVCCMHSTKEAILAREHYQGIESTIFYMDLRAIGKGFQEYVDRAERDYGVKYLRSKPGEIEEVPDTKNLIVWYEDTAEHKLKNLEFDMVILATTLLPSKGALGLANILGIELDTYGFFKNVDPLFAPMDTKVEGIYLAGYCQAPMDIPEAVAQASGAAARAAEIVFINGGIA
jgi:heterodisulfide reductase subunit A-like polyferredoxin